MGSRESELSAPSGRNSEAEIGTAKEPTGDYCCSRIEVPCQGFGDEIPEKLRGEPPFQLQGMLRALL